MRYENDSWIMHALGNVNKYLYEIDWVFFFSVENEAKEEEKSNYRSLECVLFCGPYQHRLAWNHCSRMKRWKWRIPETNSMLNWCERNRTNEKMLLVVVTLLSEIHANTYSDNDLSNSVIKSRTKFWCDFDAILRARFSLTKGEQKVNWKRLAQRFIAFCDNTLIGNSLFSLIER